MGKRFKLTINNQPFEEEYPVEEIEANVEGGEDTEEEKIESRNFYFVLEYGFLMEYGFFIEYRFLFYNKNS
jgi:hypothetical protein